ncbi:MAG: FMN-binding negative transcriptional regulator [Bacteroidetes bacterium]|nr:FMN-binding negative transcriptional regulator [Bacteroidota bacterium]
MYNYPHYKEADRKNILSFMQAHPFVTLIGTRSNGRIEATQVPVLVEERDEKLFISGHIARKSDHQQALSETLAALAIFTGAHAYVSGSWYSSNPQQASTWNYISVHARGAIQWMSEEGLREMLKKLTLHFEKGNTASSTVYENLPPDYIDKLIKAIVGFEMEVTELDNVYKLSQNRDEKSYDNIVKELKQQEGEAREVGNIMDERKPLIFPS